MKNAIPEAALVQHTALLGKTGAGKTATGKLAVEQIVRGDPRARVCILDPIKSDWWGLTSSADGKRAGLPFLILGGPRGHVPLHPSAGKAIGELVGTGVLPLSIIDMADFPPGGLQEFFNDFAPALLKKMRGVVHLVIEEAHEFAPKDRAGFGGENMTLHYAKKLATAGRSRGIRLMVMTQRTQALHNAVLGSCDTMIAHRLTAPADQEPVKKWLKANVDKATFERVANSMASLKTGTGWLCSGEAQIADLVAFPKITTFDNSATPSSGDGEHHVTMAPVDQEKLRAIIGEAVVQAQADDPKALRKRIAELEASLAQAKRQPAAPPVDNTAAIEAAHQEGWIAANKLAAANMAEAIARLAPIGPLLERFKVGHEAGMAEFAEVYSKPAPGIIHRQDPYSGPPRTVHLNGTTTPEQAARIAQTHQAKRGPDNPTDISGPQQRILDALAWLESVRIYQADRTRVAMLADQSPKSSGFRANASTLSGKCLISFPAKGDMALTGLGRAAANRVAIEATDEALHEAIRSKISGPQWAILEVLIDIYPNAIKRENLAPRAGQSPDSSGYRANISTLSGFGFVTYPQTGSVKAADILFIEGH